MKDGMNYAPEAQTRKVFAPGEFCFASAFYDHGHIYGQTYNLANAGATLKWIYDTDPARIEPVRKRFPEARVARSFDEVLEDPEVRLVTAAAIPDQRCGIGLRVMDAGKDYFTDKAPFTSLDQLARAQAAVKRTGRKYMVCYSERLQVASAWQAGELIRQGAIGRVLQVLILAPHTLNAPTRPEWFFDKARYGGILTDIGSHQFEQFLTFSGASDGHVNFARVDNLGHPGQPGLEDFGEASLTMDNGASCYCRVDWFSPAGSKVWGDGRTFVLGTEGYLEIRKYRDLARDAGDRIYLVDGKDEHVIDCAGGDFPFFPRFLQDCVDRTEHAMTQAHAFKAAELSLRAQQIADERRA